MAHIEAELNLNKTPQIVKNNSLIFAKNIKFGKDKSIMRDDKIDLIKPFDKEVDLDKIKEYDELVKRIEYLKSEIAGIENNNDTKKDIDEILKTNSNYLTTIHYEETEPSEFSKKGMALAGPDDSSYNNIGFFTKFALDNTNSEYDGSKLVKGGNLGLTKTTPRRLYSNDTIDEEENKGLYSNSLDSIVYSWFNEDIDRFDETKLNDVLSRIPIVEYNDWNVIFGYLNESVSKKYTEYKEYKDFKTFLEKPYNSEFTLYQRFVDTIKENIDIYKDKFNLINIDNIIFDSLTNDNQVLYYVDDLFINYLLHFIKYYPELIVKNINLEYASDKEEYVKELNIKNKQLQEILNEIKDINFYRNRDNLIIVGIIPYNNFYFACLSTEDNKHSFIIKIYEDNTSELIECNWNYSGGTIDGIVNIGLNDDVLLTIIEYGVENKLIPLKVINTSKSTFKDNESIYTQSPNIPLLNLNFLSYYNNIIPNGTYQFYVRYKLHNDNYTKWFPCSREFQIGNLQKVTCVQGRVQYVEDKLDANYSFVFSPNIINPDAISIYKEFQIGFILAHDDEIVARSWKHFDINTKVIYFDYSKEYIAEINIDELLEDSIQLYNIKNVTNFKNNVYISNYIENDKNPNLQDYVNKINIEIGFKPAENNRIYKFKGEEISIYSGSSDNITYKFDNIFKKYFYNKRYVYLGRPMIEGEPLFRFNVYTSNSEIDNAEYTYDNALSNNKTRYGDLVYYVPYDSNESSEQIREKLKSIAKSLNNGDEVEDAGLHHHPSSVIPTVADLKPIKISHNNITYKGNLYGYDGIISTNCDKKLINIINLKDYYLGEIIYDKLSNKVLKANIDVIPGGSKILSYIDTRYNTIKDVEFKIEYITDEYEYAQDPITLQQGLIRNRNHHTVIYKAVLMNGNIQFVDNTNYNYDVQSLVPYQGYKFYIHYVKKDGTYTNGYYIKSIDLDDENFKGVFDKTEDYVVYPKFNNIIIPDDYIACFFSLYQYKNNTLWINKIANKNYYKCLEIDASVTPLFDNIPIGDYKAIYKSSGDGSDSNTFGSAGYLSITNPKLDSTNKPIDLPEVNHITLIKDLDKLSDIKTIRCTPYINTSNYDNYSDLNLTGYRFETYRLERNDGVILDNNNKIYFVAGSDFYIRNGFNLTESNNAIAVADSTRIIGYSNYNLSLLSLAQELHLSFRSYGEGAGKQRQLIRAADSLTLSEIYMLKSMYKDYTRKYYFTVDDKSIIEFNNTIRKSEILIDEGINHNLKFSPLDYYNVPTNKGIIVNLKAIGDKILVHTEDSLFSFSGSSKISSNDSQQINLEESDPFDTGIAELFGSERGFFGLQLKTDSILTQAGYVFYDRSVNIIYLYTGQGYERISDPINKILNYKKINNVIFASDLYNDRIIIHIDFDSVDNEFITLSYNFNTKTYASLHDYKFHNSFSTKTTCYFYKLNEHIKDGVFKYVRDIPGYPHKDLIAKDLYPTININDNPAAIIDVIFNDSYERVKTLNSISWIGKEFNKIITEDPNDFNFINVAEENIFNKQCVKHIIIYSNSCLTDTIATDDNGYDYNLFKDKDEIDIRRKDRDNKGLNYPSELSISENAYKLPVYNNGVWSLNYFRNTLNKDKITGEQSLIYGNYIVVRFILDNNFKIENIIFNVQ